MSIVRVRVCALESQGTNLYISSKEKKNYRENWQIFRVSVCRRRCVSHTLTDAFRLGTLLEDIRTPLTHMPSHLSSRRQSV